MLPHISRVGGSIPTSACGFCTFMLCHVDFLQLRWFSPTPHKHAVKLIGISKLPLSGTSRVDLSLMPYAARDRLRGKYRGRATRPLVLAES